MCRNPFIAVYNLSALESAFYFSFSGTNEKVVGIPLGKFKWSGYLIIFNSDNQVILKKMNLFK